MNKQTKVERGTDSAPTIAERVARAKATQSTDGGGIIPAPTSFANVPLPEALSGTQRSAVAGLLRAGHKQTPYVYRDRSGENILAVISFRQDDGAKEFRSLRCLGKSKDGTARYDLTSVVAPRPPYNLDQIEARPTDRLLAVEGEKAADAASMRFPEFVATTWPGGAGGVSTFDEREFAARDVTLWPDNDAPGRAAMQKLAVKLLRVGCTVRVVAVPEFYPDKWDLADLDPEDAVGAAAPAALLAAAKPIDPATAAAMVRGAQPRPASPAKPSGDSSRADIVRGFAAVRFLGSAGLRDYSGYTDWFDATCAAKNSFGQPAYDEWVLLSQEYGGTDADDAMRRKWESIEERPEGDRKTIATFIAEARAAGWSDPSATGGDDDISGGGGGRADPAAFVLDQSEQAGDELWLDQYGTPHISMLMDTLDGGQLRVHCKVGGRRHKGVVSSRYRRAKPNKVLAADQEKRAMLLMEYDARESGVVHQASIRTGFHGGCLYVDLGGADGRAVRVAADGWTEVSALRRCVLSGAIAASCRPPSAAGLWSISSGTSTFR